MPRERRELVRGSMGLERKKIFVLAYEGNVTEPSYFETLKANSVVFSDQCVYLHSLKRPKYDTKSSPNHVFGALKKCKNDFEFQPGDEFWMIIDTDKWNIAEVNQWIKSEKGMYLAVSNPCFEIWLLMHKIDFNAISKDDSDKLLTNDYVGDERYIKKKLTDLVGNYEDPLVIKNIQNHIYYAIEQAKKMSKTGAEYPTQLGSDVYKLVRKLVV